MALHQESLASKFDGAIGYKLSLAMVVSMFNIEVFNTCQMPFRPSIFFKKILGTSQKCALQSFHPS